MSGVEVATMIRSIALASTPAASKALRQASSAKSLLQTPEAAKCRARIPVRSTIHSSLDSTPRAASSATRSALLSRRSGRKLPVPVMRE